jgi:hypothetical protein
MKRNKLERLLRDLKKVHQSLGDVISELDKTLEDDLNGSKPSESKGSPEQRFTEEELKSEWQRLQNASTDTSQIEQHVKDFLADKSKVDLSAFIRVNDLPIATKDSKEKIARQLIQLIRVGATVRGQ